MFYNKKYINTIITAVIMAVGVSSCTELEGDLINPDHVISLEPVMGSVEENSIANTLVAEVSYRSTDAENRPTFTLLNQSVEGALKIIGNQMMVKDPTLIDYESNTQITGQIEVTLGESVTNTIDFAVDIINLIEEDGAFITTWETVNSGEEISIYTDYQYKYDYDIDWGDGVVDQGVTSDIRHAYDTPGIHTIIITGRFPKIAQTAIDGNVNSRKLRTVEQWGENQWLSFTGAFSGCGNLVIQDEAAPDLSLVTSMYGAFSGATYFNSDIGHWDMSNVTNTAAMFDGAITFDQPIGSWDMSNVTNIVRMFRSARAFNQDINSWDVSSVEYMQSTFQNAVAFNQDLDQWDTGNVTNMSSMFWNATVFNGNIGTWDVSKVSSMSNAFRAARAFNQDLNDWNVVSLGGLFSTFREATSFNGDISNWGKITQFKTMVNAFYSARAFNSDISGWDMSQCNNMFQTFRMLQLLVMILVGGM